MSTVAVRLTGTRRRILVALNDGPVEDLTGLAVQQLAKRVGGWSHEALSALLVRMERHGLVERTVRGKRTYRLAITEAGRSVAHLPALPPRRPVSMNEMPDGPASTWQPAMLVVVPRATDLVPPAGKTATAPSTAASTTDRIATGARRSAPGTEKRLTKARVEVLRALLTGGPIDDPTGHATRILMDRTGRTDLSGTHTLITGMAEAGLVRRILQSRRVVRLEAVPEALSARDLRLVWSTTTFPIDTTPAAPPTSPVRPSVAEVEALRDELATTRAELARTRLQLQMFRAWAKRMPLDPSDDHLPTPKQRAARSPAARTVPPDRVDHHAENQARCQYVHPDGRSCELHVWEGSRQWCWHHDPRPIGRRRAPVRRVTTAA